MNQIEELKAAYKTVTTEKWVTDGSGTTHDPLLVRTARQEIALFHPWFAQKHANATFIALAHNAMPMLLEAVEALRNLYDEPSGVGGDWTHSRIAAKAILAKLEGDMTPNV